MENDFSAKAGRVTETCSAKEAALLEPTYNHHIYGTIYLGFSDNASLMIRTPENAFIMHFGEDADYRAYLVDRFAVIPEHYKLVCKAARWIWIFDDTGRRTGIDGEQILIYRAGEHGCIIQVVNEKPERKIGAFIGAHNEDYRGLCRKS